MKLDREQFLAAVLLLGAATAAAGCSKSSDAPAAVKDEAAPRPVANRIYPSREGGIPSPVREGIVPPAKEGAVPPPPAQEGKPGGGVSPSKTRPFQKVGGND
jgi:hypothetical protein